MAPGPDSRDLPLRHTQDRGEPGVGAGTMGELQGPEHEAELPVERAAPLIGPGCAELEHSLSLSIAGVRVRGSGVGGGQAVLSSPSARECSDLALASCPLHSHSA